MPIIDRHYKSLNVDKIIDNKRVGCLLVMTPYNLCANICNDCTFKNQINTNIFDFSSGLGSRIQGQHTTILRRTSAIIFKENGGQNCNSANSDMVDGK